MRILPPASPPVRFIASHLRYLASAAADALSSCSSHESSCQRILPRVVENSSGRPISTRSASVARLATSPADGDDGASSEILAERTILQSLQHRLRNAS